MARSKAVARKPGSVKVNEAEVKDGRVEKLGRISANNKTALKSAAEKTPSSLSSKKKRPISRKQRQLNIDTRKSLASGELAAEDLERRKQRDLRTLYLRFKDKNKLPENQDVVKSLHTDIQEVRLPRQVRKRILYAYIEFNSEAKCEEAKLTLEKNDGFYVDFVGFKSKGGGKSKAQRGGKGKSKKQINPTRLFITGLIEGMTEKKLKQLFPKCYKAVIPMGSMRKGTQYGFVQFGNPADAKSAFEAAKKLTVQTKDGSGAQHITVLYATASNHPPSKTINAKREKKDHRQKNDTVDSKVTSPKPENKHVSIEKQERKKNGQHKDKFVKVKNEESEDEDDKELENDKESEDEECPNSGSDQESNDGADQNMTNDEDSDEDDHVSKQSNNGNSEENDEDSSEEDDNSGSDE